jgi:LysM repeat protein
MKLTVENKKEPKPKPPPKSAVTPPKEPPAEAVDPKPAEENKVHEVAPVGKSSKREISPWIAWAAAGIMILILVFVTLQFLGVIPSAEAANQPVITQTALDVPIPEFQPTAGSDALKPIANPKTTRPDRGSEYASSYVVQKGDSIFGIANQYKLKPESVLWSNYGQLKDDPQNISVGSTLNIPPVDGIYYLWQQGDTLDSVSGKYQVEPDDILMWPGTTSIWLTR